jgi:hypothetical protein
VLSACTEHDYENELSRVGSPVPDIDASSGDAAAPLDAATDANLDAGPPVPWCASSSDAPSAYRVMAVCRRCHQDPPLFLAPFGLLTWDDTQQPFGVLGRKRHERMFEVVRDDIMPYRFSTIDPPVLPLTSDDKATLLAWLAQGAQPIGGRDCEGQ